MIIGEVIFVEEKNNGSVPNEPGYTPRPAWQVWLARIGVIAMSAFVVFQVLNLLLGWGA